MGNRPPGGYVGASRQLGRNTHWQNQNALRFGQFGISTRFPPHCFRLAPLAENAIHQESPAVGCPPYDHQRKKNLCGITRSVAHLTNTNTISAPSRRGLALVPFYIPLGM
ncbi:MAG: hypothetical protein LBQ66_10780 [Planctomycetaceae bacterium]|nr:hypothetical protein [Planctomycetaceae bacterium]